MNRYVLIGVVILAIIGILFWFAWRPPPKKQPESTPYVVHEVQPRENSPQERPQSPVSTRLGEAGETSRSFKFFDTVAPLIKPFEELIENIVPSNPLYLKEELPKEAQGVIKKPLTEQEIFNWVWPEDYRR
ncbi:MAG: hypothetical protein HYZ69_00500, partial [Candidatus Colwellbacteria bacterium]|nr:hypothetical protein [Candidatus Colwellbacteria bacterium]